MQGKWALAAAIGLALAGCGGGGGDDEGSKPIGGSGAKYDGIYVEPNYLGMMLVDTGRKSQPVIIADFSTSVVMVADTAKLSNKKLTTTGLTLADGSSGSLVYSPAMQSNITFGNNSAKASIDLAGEVYSFDLTKAPDSLAVEAVSGSHLNYNDGAEWIINEDGTFTVNGTCTVSGTFERKDEYFNVTEATAVSCGSDGFEGKYTYGVIVTLSNQGSDYVAGVIGRKGNLLWGSAELSN